MDAFENCTPQQESPLLVGTQSVVESKSYSTFKIGQKVKMTIDYPDEDKILGNTIPNGEWLYCIVTDRVWEKIWVTYEVIYDGITIDNIEPGQLHEVRPVEEYLYY